MPRRKTEGCTEAEALAAAELAQRLMVKYGLTLSELQAISSPIDACDSDGVAIGNRRSHEVLHVSNAIAHYTDTRCWYQRHGVIHGAKGRLRIHAHHGVILIFFGLDADVQVAIYLTNTLRSAFDREWEEYWRANGKSSNASARTARANFMRGLANKISARLYQMKATQQQKPTENNRQIILAKEQIVRTAFEAMKTRPRCETHYWIRKDASAFAAGR